MAPSLLRAAAIVAIGGGAGLAWNAWSGRGLALAENVLVRQGDEVVDTREARARFDRGALFLDARPEDFWRMERIPGSRPLPDDDFEAAFARLEPTLRSRLDIVVYCAGFGCEASHSVARRLRDRGIHAAIFADGWPAWTEAGHPTESGPPSSEPAP
jgi:rhodanese-related sulfurtransferase